MGNRYVLTDAIKCKFCGTPTTNYGTKMCDRCWEVDSRIDRFALTEAGQKRLIAALPASVRKELGL